MPNLEIKKAKIISLHPSGMKAMVGDRQGFIRRWNVDWKDPYIDFYGIYQQNDEVDVAIIGKDEDYDNLILSIKHVKYNPWVNFEKYKRSLDKNENIEVRGIVNEVLSDKIYILLEDYNNAVLNRDDLSVLKNYRNKSLSSIFSIGDYVRGFITNIDEISKTIEISASSYAFYLKQRDKTIQKITLRDSLNDTSIEALKRASLASIILSQQSSEMESSTELTNNDHHNIFIIENEISQGEKLKKTFANLKVKHKLFIVSDQNCTELENEIQNIDQYTAVFIDKHLDIKNGTEFASRILDKSQIPIIIITAESPIRAINKLKDENLYDKVYLLIRPYSIGELISVLEWSLKPLIERLNIIKENQYEQSSAYEAFIAESELIERKLNELKGDSQRCAFILELNPITSEIELIFSKGLNAKDWKRYKSELRHTPFFDIIMSEKPSYFHQIPEKRKLHFPLELRNTQGMSVIPVKLFGEARYGICLLDMRENNLSYADHMNVMKIAYELLAPLGMYFFKKSMQDDLKFKSMGLLYSAMRHDLFTHVDGVNQYCKDIVENWQKSKDQLISHDKIMDILINVSSAVKEIQSLFDFYTMLEKGADIKKTVEIKCLVSKVISIVEKSDDASGVKIELIDKRNQDYEVFASPMKLQQVFLNVLLNACQQINQQYLPAKKISVELTYLEESNNKKAVAVTISDTGPGIHRKDFDRIFSPLYTTREGGMGLGLNICNDFLINIGGNIKVLNSFILTGTQFLIELPVRCL